MVLTSLLYYKMGGTVVCSLTAAVELIAHLLIVGGICGSGRLGGRILQERQTHPWHQLPLALGAGQNIVCIVISLDFLFLFRYRSKAVFRLQKWNRFSCGLGVMCKRVTTQKLKASDRHWFISYKLNTKLLTQ